MKNAFYGPPSIMSKVTECPDILKMVGGGLIAQVVTCTDPLDTEETVLSSLPTTKAFSASTIDWNHQVDQPIRVKDILHNYLGNIDIKHLILAQKQDSWISKLEVGKNKVYFKCEDIVMTKKQLDNGIWVSQIV